MNHAMPVPSLGRPCRVTAPTPGTLHPITHKPMGRQARQSNLYRHGFEYAALRVQDAARSARSGATITALVLDDGTVCLSRNLPDAELLQAALDARYVGTYTRADRIESIEDDFLCWMRGA